jgi:MoaA/NifB/PqqE/SkfB family radical SAM enzyme
MIFTQLYQEGIRFVFLQGGEPTLRNDLIDIIYDLDDIGFTQTLITNGTRLSQRLIDKLAKVPISLSISLDTLHADRYEAIRGANQLKLVMNGIDRLENYPHPKYLTCIVSDGNRNDVMDVLHYAKEKRFVPVVGAYHWDVERYGKSDLMLQYKKSAAIAVFTEIITTNLIPKGYFKNYIQDNIDWLNDEGLPTCDAGRYSIAIDSSANVAPCLALEHKGNLLTHSLRDILQNFDSTAIASCSNQSSCNMMCSRVVGSFINKPLSGIATAKAIKSSCA